MNAVVSHTAPVAHGKRPRRHPLLGGLLVKDHLINQAQLERILALQDETEPRPLLGQLLVEQKLLTPHELNLALAKYRREHLLGDILVETNLVTAAQLETALATQRQAGAPLGKTLIELGYITERQLKQALSLQLRIAYVDLDRRSIDPALAALVSERYAHHHRVIPIAKTDDRVVVAMDDPTDTNVLTELRACTGLLVEPVATTSDVMARALARLYGPHPEAPHGEGHVARAVETSPSRPPEPTPRPLHPVPAAAGKNDPAPPWQPRADAVETMLRERDERRGDTDRLLAELRSSHVALARARRDLDAQAVAVARLERAHDDLRRRNQALERSLAQLEARHATLLRDRDFVLERVESALRRLTS
jgi:hypothetical protein